MKLELSNALFLIGIGQLGVLIASALVPVQLNWKQSLEQLPPLMRQLFWIYGGYVVLSIVSLGLICVFNAEELARPGGLALGVCAYGLAFWGIRLVLQPVLAARPFLTNWWLYSGYHLLTVLFASFVTTFTWALVQNAPL